MNFKRKIKSISIIIALVFSVVGFSQTKQGEKVNWIECIGTGMTEFGPYCLATENNNARAYITNNCTEKVKVFYEFTGPRYDNNISWYKTKNIVINGNSKKRVEFCNVTENNGSIRVTKVVPVDQQSASTSSSNDKGNQNEWGDDESLIGSTNQSRNNNSSQRQEESIYQKRQREAREREQREREHYRKQQEQVDEVIRQGETRTNAIKQAKQTWENTFNDIQDNISREIEEDHRQMRESQLAEQREYARQNRLREERERRERVEREKREREAAEQRRVSNAQNSFIQSITDQKIPLFFDQHIAYVLFISKTNSEGLLLIPTLLHKNSDNQLPYKRDVINALEKDRNLKNLYVYGVYNDFEEFKSAAVKLSTQAQNSYISISEIKRFEYGTPQNNKTKTNSSQEDFWGEKKKKPTSKKTDDFWNN